MKRPGSRDTRWEDHFTRRARQEHFPARSVYKLQEIQARYRILRPGGRVLDLGCAPGSWLKYAAGLVGPQGRVVGVDLQPVAIALPPQVRVIQGDVLRWEPPPPELEAERFDVLLSDMAPATTGHRGVDHARSLALCEAALHWAGRVLVPGGAFVCKLFQGEDFSAFTRSVRPLFATLQLFKPQSSRKASREIFVIGLEKK
jgi:23S rRNA (uridine2552-2'-O)-methyltransferase